MASLATIGYQGATVHTLLESLRRAKIDLLVDVRAVTSSRRPGFAKSQLTANLLEAGIEYLHLRSLGTPADGRAAARAGRYEELRKIYHKHLATAEAQAGLDALADLVYSSRHVCLLCFEADPAQCHRSMIATALAARRTVQVTHLMPFIP